MSSIKKSALVTLTLVSLLAGCTQEPSPPFEIKNRIKEISFFGAHEERRCSKGCRYKPRPDTWYILFCNVKNAADCYWEDINHAPWKWQKEGTEVTMTRYRDEWGYLKMLLIVDTVTGEKLEM